MRIGEERGVRTHTLVVVFILVGVLAGIAQDSKGPTALPDSPGTVASAQKTPASGPTAEQAANGQRSTQLAENAPDQKPVGTAAAQKPATTGVAASDAAGAAIAPAKQKRSRMLLMKVGAIIGAGVAVGTVAALSSASPNRPPGTH